jgi:hypothetical protein
MHICGCCVTQGPLVGTMYVEPSNMVYIHVFFLFVIFFLLTYLLTNLLTYLLTNLLIYLLIDLPNLLTNLS